MIFQLISSIAVSLMLRLPSALSAAILFLVHFANVPQASAGIAEVIVGSYDGHTTYDVQCGVERKACKVSFGASSISIEDGSQIPYSSIIDVQGSDLASVECAKEQPSLPYKQQARGFPCWSGTPSYYVLIAHKNPEGIKVLSAFSFKNMRIFKEFLMNAFAVRFTSQSDGAVSK